jgi:serine/threonine protein kinase
MGAIWLAEHEKLKSEVVVKFIIGEDAMQEEARARFEREATLAARAKSPYVVQVFDHGVTAEGVPYIAMERLVGEDLATRMNREGPIRPEVFVEWFRQACAGLARAHDKQIVHRDLKPENIFLCNEDGAVLVKLLDFGIAKGGPAGSGLGATMTGAMLGTVHYMSPEQTMGASEVDARSDLWAMGVLTYYALTGKLPFTGEGIGVIVTQISLSEPPPPSELMPGLPKAVDAFMKKALAKDPNQRFQSAREMSSALTQAVLGHEVDSVRDFGLWNDTSRISDGVRNVTTLAPATAREIRMPLPPKRTRNVVLAVSGGALVALAALYWMDREDRPELVPHGTADQIAAHATTIPAITSEPEVLTGPAIEEPPAPAEPPVVQSAPAVRAKAAPKREVATKKRGGGESKKIAQPKKASDLKMNLE